MAKSEGYFGLRRGSTKSHTFQVSDGKQITKDRVGAPKNPRTIRQMSQRVMIATIGKAYSEMKAIADHSFEGVSAGMPSLRTFMHTNQVAIMLNKQYGNTNFGYAKYNEDGCVLGSYIISKGSLDSIAGNLAVQSVNAAGKQAVLAVAYGMNIADFCDEFGMVNYGDMATICFLFKKKGGKYGFGAVRFTYKQGASIAESFDLAAAGDVNGASIAVAGNELKLTVQTKSEWADGATADDVHLTAIASRYINGKWYRSTAQFEVEDCAPTFAEALATYPVGQERFLNGDGSVAAAASDTPAQPGTTTPTLTINRSGSGTSVVKVNGSPINSGAEVAAGTTVTVEVTPPANAESDPDVRINNQGVELSGEGTLTGTFQMPAANATLTIDSGSAGGDSGLDEG